MLSPINCFNKQNCFVDCYLKASALKSSKGFFHYVKRNHPGPLRDLIAKNIRKLRAERNISQESLAHDSGINRSYLSGVECAERNISIDNVARIAKALNVKPWILLHEE